MLGIMSLNAGYEYFMELCPPPNTHALTVTHTHPPHLTVDVTERWEGAEIGDIGDWERYSDKIHL